MRNLILSLTLCAAGCTAQYPESPTPTPSLAGIRIHYVAPHSWVNPSNSVNFVLYAINSDGVYESVTSRAAWFSSNTAVASVTNSGVARGVAGGSADIVASYQGFTSTARVMILNPATVNYPFLDVRMSSVPETGRSSRAQALYTLGPNSASRDVSAEASWTSSDERVFTVLNGNVTAQGPGTASITATYSGATATSYASVAPIRTLP